MNLFTDIFGKHLNYDVTVEFDQTKNKTLALLKDFAERKELADHDAFVAIIMSHGVKNHFITHDSEKVAFSEIYTIFGKEECPHLDGKPKTFIFNCCRVPEKKTPKPRPTRHVYKDYESDDYVDDEEKTKIFFGDTFVVFSTLDGKLSISRETIFVIPIYLSQQNITQIDIRTRAVSLRTPSSTPWWTSRM